MEFWADRNFAAHSPKITRQLHPGREQYGGGKTTHPWANVHREPYMHDPDCMNF